MQAIVKREYTSYKDIFGYFQIAHFKIPYYIQFVEDYPMTVTGKIQKFKMRQAAIKQLHLEDV